MSAFEENFVYETCPQCEGQGQIPKIGFDEDGYAIQDLWKDCAHCEDGTICGLCDSKPTACERNGQCYPEDVNVGEQATL
jgi:hypothetical protein